MPFRLFLAHSFARDKPNGGISDFELADLVAGWIHEFSHGRIVVVRTRDPFQDYVSARVRRDISSSDGTLCLFTKRTQDAITKLWISSTYVISEGSAALMQFPTEEETHRRLFGLAEDGVDTSQLGMAFHRNKTVLTFRRDDREQLISHVRQIVDGILAGNTVGAREGWKYLSIDKVVSIWRSGGVFVETRHRFRFTAELTDVKIPHIMWRVGRELPELGELLDGKPGAGAGFLHVMPLICGRHEPDLCRCEIKPGGPTRWGYERNFFVEFTNVNVSPGDELAYEVVWGYPHAFHNRGISPDEKPNSVGLRTSGRGTAESASLTLKFQRDWDGEPSRTLESCPKVFTTDTTDLPGAHSPQEFLHGPNWWTLNAELRPCRKRSCNLSEIYYWETSMFHGMAKAIWTPHLNYFDSSDLEDQTGPRESVRADKSGGESRLAQVGI